MNDALNIRAQFAGRDRIRTRPLAFASAALAAALFATYSCGGQGDRDSESASSPSSSPPAEAALALRYGVAGGREVLLEVTPFQVGRNTFRATAFDGEDETVAVSSVRLRFSKLENDAPPVDVQATTDGDQSYVADFDLQETGWWAIEAVVNEAESVTYYLRLDSPSRAPLEYAAPDYASDPEAEAAFRKAREAYEGLQSLKRREELTSGFTAPTGTGVSIVTESEAQAPDRLHYEVRGGSSPGYQTYRVGSTSCTETDGNWKCSDGEPQVSFDLNYLKPTAFKLGRMEQVGGEMGRALLFYSGRAWYAWWVGEATGVLYRQAMVTPGHFMVTAYSGHNEPVVIEIPGEALIRGG